MFTLHQKHRELLKKTFFQLPSGLLLKYKMVTTEHRKKCKKGKKRMTPNTNHKYAPYSFILYNLTLFFPMYPSPKTYKNVVNCSKKPFFSYVPVCYEFTRQLPNNAEISAKKGEKMAKKHMKTQKNHPRNKSQIGNRKYSSIRARSRRLVRINAYKKMKAPLETWQASCRNSLNGKDY